MAGEEKGLREVRLRKWGSDLYLFGNEGKETICTEVTLTDFSSPLFMDLWTGRCYTVKDVADTFMLYLWPGETLLVIDQGAAALEGAALEGAALEDADLGGALCDHADHACIEQRSADWYQKEYPDWTGQFEIQEKGENVVSYVCHKQLGHVTGQECFLVRGEEMIECYCNGSFVDVSFWGVHRFEIGGFLKEGDNEIRLVATGNAANIYEKAGISFGLG